MGKIFSFKDTSKEIKEVERRGLEELREAVKYNEKAEKTKPVIVVEFSWGMLALVILILAIIFFGNQLVSVAIFLFLGFVFTSAARPVINWLISKRIPRGWSVTITYFVAVILMLSILSVVIIPLVSQLSDLVKVFPGWVEQLVANFNGFTFGSITIDSAAVTQFVSNGLQTLSVGDSFKNIAGAVTSVFGTTGLMVSSLILSIYLSLEHDSILEFGLIKVVSDEKRDRIKKLVLDVERKLGRWMLGQATVSTIAGVFAGILLTIFQVPFALPLALLVALLDAVPGIGATIAVALCALIALITVGLWPAVILLAIFLVYQQIENNFIIPKVIGNAIGFKPVIIMLGVFTFLILFGILGALVAVPLMVMLQIFYEFYIDLQKLKAKGIV
ncbi:AI-2E family transporter [Patescibacteria group bacterium]|nr:AI-2E family transporter [Patescibacteria group bacterium]